MGMMGAPLLIAIRAAPVRVLENCPMDGLSEPSGKRPMVPPFSNRATAVSTICSPEWFFRYGDMPGACQEAAEYRYFKGHLCDEHINRFIHD